MKHVNCFAYPFLLGCILLGVVSGQSRPVLEGLENDGGNAAIGILNSQILKTQDKLSKLESEVAANKKTVASLKQEVDSLRKAAIYKAKNSH